MVWELPKTLGWFGTWAAHGKTKPECKDSGFVFSVKTYSQYVMAVREGVP
jgi:hypothetical protein